MVLPLAVYLLTSSFCINMETGSDMKTMCTRTLWLPSPQVSKDDTFRSKEIKPDLLLRSISYSKSNMYIVSLGFETWQRYFGDMSALKPNQ